MSSEIVQTQDLLAQLQTANVTRKHAVQARGSLVAAKRAQRLAGTAEREAARRLEVARARERELASGRGSQLHSFAGVTVYEFWIEMPGYSGSIRGATARLTQHGDLQQVSNVTGTTKGGIGGAVVGGLLLGPLGALGGIALTRKNEVKTDVKTVDTRRFELEVLGPGLAWSTIQEPGSESGLRDLRDLINRRGSTPDDIGAFVANHAAVLVETSRAVDDCHEQTEAAGVVVFQRQREFDTAAVEYSRWRLPFRLYVRARWLSSQSFARAVFVVLGPIILSVWFLSHVIDRLLLRAAHVGSQREPVSIRAPKPSV